MRLVVVDLLGQQECVGAQDHELLARQEALHDLRHLAMQQWLAAGDRYDGRAAFVDRAHAIVVRQPLVEDLRRIVDLAAAGAGQVAAEQRLEHQHQRIALAAAQMLAQQVGADAGGLVERDSHGVALPDRCWGHARRLVRPELGRQSELDVLAHAAPSSRPRLRHAGAASR